MRLLDLVEQHDRVRATAHGLGQLTALFVPDVAGRRTDQARDGVTLGVLRHVDAHHGALVVEEEVGERLRELRLAHTRRAEEQERTGRTIGVGDAGARTAHGVTDSLDRGLLTDEALAEEVLHAQQLLGLALEQTPGGDAGPAGDDLGDVVGGHLVGDHRRLAAGLRGRRLGCLRLVELLLKSRDVAVEQLRGVAVVTFALQLLGLRAQVVDLGLEITDLVEAGLLGLPTRRQRGELFLGVGAVGPQLRESVARGRVGLALEVQFFHVHAVDAAAQLVDLDGARVDLHAQTRRGLVDEVDRLVGQLSARDVAVTQRRSGDERLIGDGDLVVRLVALLEAAQDRDRVLDARLTDEHLLETTLQRRVLLDVLAVLVERRRTDETQLAAREHRLEHVAGVHRRVAAGTRADDGVDLVDERDDLAVGVLDLLEDGLEALLELAAVLRTGDHCAEVEGDEALVAQALRHVPGDDALRETLDDGRLADAGLTDEDGVVLRAAAQHLHDATDLAVAADDGVELALTGEGRQVGAELLERLERALGLGGGDLAATARRGDRLLDRLRVQRGELARASEREQQVVGRGERIPHGAHVAARLLEHVEQLTAHAGLAHACTRAARERAQVGLGLRDDCLRSGARRLEQRACGRVGLFRERLEEVRGLDRGVAGRLRGRHGGGEGLLRLRCQLKIHC